MAGVVYLGNRRWPNYPNTSPRAISYLGGRKLAQILSQGPVERTDAKGFVSTLLEEERVSGADEGNATQGHLTMEEEEGLHRQLQ